MPLHSFSSTLVLVWLFSTALAKGTGPFPGLRPKVGDADYLEGDEYPVVWPLRITCGRGTRLPDWTNAIPAPFNANPRLYRNLESLCGFHGARLPAPQYSSNRENMLRTRSANLGGICNTLDLPPIPQAEIAGSFHSGIYVGPSPSEVIFAEALAAPELYSNDALLVYCMRHCQCAAQPRAPAMFGDSSQGDDDADRDDEDDDEGGGRDKYRNWFTQGLRPGIGIDNANGGLVVRNKDKGTESTLVDPNSRLALSLVAPGVRRGRWRKQKKLCPSTEGDCPVCRIGECTAPGDCEAGLLAAAAVGEGRCACRASMRIDGDRGKWTSWCGLIPLEMTSLLGKRDNGIADPTVTDTSAVLEGCACNSTYISRGCCDSADGMVWEGTGAWLGSLV